MRAVLDTNTLVSGIISSGGPPRRLLDGARAQLFELCSSTILLAELLVTGDRHLLELGGSHQGIPIVSPAEAVRMLWG